MIRSDQPAPVPENEFQRALKLSDLEIDYTVVNEKMQKLSKLAAHVAGTPISLINLLDTTTQWSVSSFGIDLKQMPREDSVCQYVVLNDQPVEVKDLSTDPRFNDKDYVAGDPNLRYYYGVPLTSSDGFTLGAVCVLDDKARELSPEKTELLQIIAQEVISQIEYENRIQSMRSSLEDVSDMTRKVSHDIRGPISGIIGLAEILKNQAEDHKLKDFIDLLDLINKGGRSVLDLADEILTSYRDIQGNIKSLGSHEMNLETLKEKLVNLYTPQALNKDIDFTVTVASDNTGLIFPKAKLLQILGNLISNGIKFTPPRGYVKVTIAVEAGDLNHLLKVLVEDSGVGMTQEQILAVVNKKASTTAGTKNERGYGFGLQLASHLIEKSKGSIQIDSEENVGTVIQVEIPFKAD